ncbi:MAG TPA: hypothetical protein DDZ04_01490 [Parabacteroides sp.]|nr:hypothetical protein [Parabacteroides sp.]
MDKRQQKSVLTFVNGGSRLIKWLWPIAWKDREEKGKGRLCCRKRVRAKQETDAAVFIDGRIRLCINY